MENTSSSEINIPKSHIIVVKEAPEQPNQEDLENKPPENTSNVEEQPDQEDIEKRSQKQKTSNVEECHQEQEFEELGEVKTSIYWNGLYVLVILGVCVLWTSTYTIIPATNSFEYPEYWWEHVVIRGSFYTILAMMLPTLWELQLIFKADSPTSNLQSIIYSTIFYAGSIIPYLIIYIVWTVYMGFNFPMPLGNLPSGIFASVSAVVAIWFGFPCELRSEPVFRKRIISWIIYLIIFYSVY